MKVWLYGASGHGRVIIEILKDLNYTIKGVFDDGDNLHSSLLKIPILGKFAQNEWSTSDKLIISIGDNLIRKKISKRINVEFTKAIHPSAIISSSVVINVGTVVMAGAIVNSCTKIGEHCIINTNSSIDHDCLIGNFVHISPGAVLTGGVTIGEGAHIGAGAIIIPGIKIGKWVTVGAGAVIIKDIPDYTTVVGNPGKIIK